MPDLQISKPVFKVQKTMQLYEHFGIKSVTKPCLLKDQFLDKNICREDLEVR